MTELLREKTERGWVDTFVVGCFDTFGFVEQFTNLKPESDFLAAGGGRSVSWSREEGPEAIGLVELPSAGPGRPTSTRVKKMGLLGALIVLTNSHLADRPPTNHVCFFKQP